MACRYCGRDVRAVSAISYSGEGGEWCNTCELFGMVNPGALRAGTFGEPSDGAASWLLYQSTAPGLAGTGYALKVVDGIDLLPVSNECAGMVCVDLIDSGYVPRITQQAAWLSRIGFLAEEFPVFRAPRTDHEHFGRDIGGGIWSRAPSRFCVHCGLLRMTQRPKFVQLPSLVRCGDCNGFETAKVVRVWRFHPDTGARLSPPAVPYPDGWKAYDV